MNDRDAGAADGVGLNLPPPVVDPDDPLLIAQTLTYVTDNGSVLLSFTLAPFLFGAPSCRRCVMLSSLVALAARRPTDIPSLFLSLPAPLFSVQAALLPLRGALRRDPPARRPRRRPRHRRQHLHRQPLRRRVVLVQLRPVRQRHGRRWAPLRVPSTPF